MNAGGRGRRPRLAHEPGRRDGEQDRHHGGHSDPLDRGLTALGDPRHGARLGAAPARIRPGREREDARSGDEARATVGCAGSAGIIVAATSAISPRGGADDGLGLPCQAGEPPRVRRPGVAQARPRRGGATAAAAPAPRRTRGARGAGLRAREGRPDPRRTARARGGGGRVEADGDRGQGRRDRRPAHRGGGRGGGARRPVEGRVPHGGRRPHRSPGRPPAGRPPTASSRATDRAPAGRPAAR